MARVVTASARNRERGPEDSVPGFALPCLLPAQQRGAHGHSLQVVALQFHFAATDQW